MINVPPIIEKQELRTNDALAEALHRDEDVSNDVLSQDDMNITHLQKGRQGLFIRSAKRTSSQKMLCSRTSSKS